MKCFRYVGLVVLFSLALGCSHTPTQSVELSATVGRDLAELHRAHHELAVAYFATIKKNINSFIDETYRPYLIRSTIQQLQLVAAIEAAIQPGAPHDVVWVMEIYVKKIVSNIEQMRNEYLQAITEKETSVLRAIDDSYANVQNANAIVTGHLSSIVKVQDAHAVVLDKLGVQDLRMKAIQGAAELSDKIASITDEAQDLDAALESAGPRVVEISSKLKNVLRQND